MDKEQNVTRKITHTGRWHTKLLRNTEKRYRKSDNKQTKGLTAPKHIATWSMPYCHVASIHAAKGHTADYKSDLNTGGEI